MIKSLPCRRFLTLRLNINLIKNSFNLRKLYIKERHDFKGNNLHFGEKLAKVWLKRYKYKSEAGLRVIEVTDEAVGNSFTEKQ
jgi:hypothetical protein